MAPHNQSGYKARLKSIIKEFEGKTFEREELIRLIIVAIFCKQHIFLFGRPGVGKTYIARLATMMFGTDAYWELLMAHDTTTEQLMGSLIKDENGKVRRNLSDSMLDKPFVFLDEMFKGSNKVLNALLGPMLDRRYTEGGYTVEVPLITLFGASNEFPEGEDIKPFEDRLMFRYDVQRIQLKENKIRFNNGEFDQSDKFHTKFELDEIDYVEEHATKTIFPHHMLENYIAIQEAIIKDRIMISDRKFGPGQAVKVFRISAYLNNRKEIDFSDLMLLSHIAWHSLTDKKKLTEVLTYSFFGNIVSIEKSQSDIEEKYIRVSGNIESNIMQIIRYEKEYIGQASHSMFKNDVNLVQHYIVELGEILKGAKNIDGKKKMALEIEEQCANNIFLFNIKQPTFTPALIERISHSLEGVQSLITLLTNWTAVNQKIFNYNTNRSEKIHQ
jgi:MoxR-like ATPase